MEANAPESKTTKHKAVAYVRMSTEHQQYSTSNQMDIIEKYAQQNDIEIVYEYSDDGKSGLNIKGRDSLSELISVVESGNASFNSILVYDVSRWGRFQDADESAYYEFICKRAGITVHYCAEQFKNDGSPVSTIVKGVKRAMAGEYSRELSAKVFQGACRLIQMGYKQGGHAGYGLRRMLVDQSGKHKGVLEFGEQKSIQTDRVILVPGPVDEIETVNWIYSQFIDKGMTESQIAESLNNKGIKTDMGRDWNRSTIHQVLTNEKYIGHNVYHKTANKLKKKSVKNSEDKWIRKENAFDAIIEPNIFYTARGIILARSHKLSDEELLAKLKKLREQHGRLSGILIDEAEDMPSSSAYSSRFGSLIRAYQLVGYTPERDYRYIEINRNLRQMYPDLLDDIINKIREEEATIQQDLNTDKFWINGEFTFSLVMCRCYTTPSGSARWKVRFDEGVKPDFTIAVRLNEDNKTIRDYYIFPRLDLEMSKLRIAESNGIYLDIFRHDTLEEFVSITRRTQIERAA